MDPQMFFSSWLIRSCFIGFTTFYYTLVYTYIYMGYIHVLIICLNLGKLYPNLPCRSMQYINIVHMIIHCILPFAVVRTIPKGHGSGWPSHLGAPRTWKWWINTQRTNSTDIEGGKWMKMAIICGHQTHTYVLMTWNLEFEFPVLSMLLILQNMQPAGSKADKQLRMKCKMAQKELQFSYCSRTVFSGCWHLPGCLEGH